ncbi:hypothetical protein HDF15_000983 [Granulicella mallensis]|uniref:Uncharacterized protein n=1 Tax=Granulicella mallensis TaxID=940614 RepID=A0A7W7ZMX0_9BACT|nr:hypothetical protein [Granulicella mallensis]
MCSKRPTYSSGFRDLIDFSAKGEIKLRVSSQEIRHRPLNFFKS